MDSTYSKPEITELGDFAEETAFTQGGVSYEIIPPVVGPFGLYPGGGK